MRRIALAAALVLAASPALAADDDFEEEVILRSIALGPVPPASADVVADLGWVRSGLRVDLGLRAGLDLTIRAEVFAHRGLDGQNAGFAGLRFSPFEGNFRLTLASEFGFVFVPELVGSRDLFVIRGEAAIGYFVNGYAPYVRAAVRGLRFDAIAQSGWDQDGELAGGVEHAFGKLLVAAEASAWLQPGVRGLPQWRLRVGWAF